MNQQRSLQSIILICLLIFPFMAIAAQDSAPQPQTSPSVEAMGENDRITFLQSDRPADTGDPSSGTLLLKTIGAMAVIIGLIFTGSWAVRKYGLPGMQRSISGSEPDLKVLSTVSLGSGRSISTIRFGDRVLVVGSTAQEFTLLAEQTLAIDESIDRSRSVADMLADDEVSFDVEFERAQDHMDSWQINGVKA